MGISPVPSLMCSGRGAGVCLGASIATCSGAGAASCSAVGASGAGAGSCSGPQVLEQLGVQQVEQGAQLLVSHGALLRAPQLGPQRQVAHERQVVQDARLLLSHGASPQALRQEPQLLERGALGAPLPLGAQREALPLLFHFNCVDNLNWLLNDRSMDHFHGMNLLDRYFNNLGVDDCDRGLDDSNRLLDFNLMLDDCSLDDCDRFLYCLLDLNNGGVNHRYRLLDCLVNN
ncbi:hypothetical protein HG530_013880 [Fusarium avenaceum]|nr:hypothetical protein HG530_013880 [Fusarium avenaceum]